MKKVLAIVLAVVMVLSLTACVSADDLRALSDKVDALSAKVDALSAGEQAAAPAEAPVEEPVAAPADDGKVYNVSIELGYPEESGAGLLKVMSEIEEESGGRLKFEYYWSYSFVDAGDIIDALATNQLNMAGFMPAEHLGEMPLNGALTTLPLMNYPDWDASSRILLSAIYNNQAMLDEYTDNGMVFYAGYMCPGYQFYSTKEITDTTPSAFNGLTVMCDQAQMASFINEYKGGAISAFPPDYLSNLQNGVADALVQHVNCAYVFGCFDYVKTAVFFGEGGFYNFPFVYTFSESFWNSLPADLQEIFIRHAAELCYESHLSDAGLYYNVAYPTLDSNAEIIVLNEEEIAAWQEAIKPIVDASLEEIAADNAAAPGIYDQIKAMIADYDPDTFDIGTNNFGCHADWVSY